MRKKQIEMRKKDMTKKQFPNINADLKMLEVHYSEKLFLQCQYLQNILDILSRIEKIAKNLARQSFKKENFKII